MNIAPPGVCVCVRACSYAGVVFTPLTRGEKFAGVFFFPSSSSSLLFRQSRVSQRCLLCVILSRLREDKLLTIITTRLLFIQSMKVSRFLLSPFLFLVDFPSSRFIAQKTQKKSSFLLGRLTLGSTRGQEGDLCARFTRLLQSRFVTTRLHARGARGIAAYRGQGFLGIRGNTFEGGWRGRERWNYRRNTDIKSRKVSRGGAASKKCLGAVLPSPSLVFPSRIVISSFRSFSAGGGEKEEKYHALSSCTFFLLPLSWGRSACMSVHARAISSCRVY